MAYRFPWRCGQNELQAFLVISMWIKHKSSPAGCINGGADKCWAYKRIESLWTFFQSFACCYSLEPYHSWLFSREVWLRRVFRVVSQHRFLLNESSTHAAFLLWVPHLTLSSPNDRLPLVHRLISAMALQKYFRMSMTLFHRLKRISVLALVSIAKSRMTTGVYLW